MGLLLYWGRGRPNWMMAPLPLLPVLPVPCLALLELPLLLTLLVLPPLLLLGLSEVYLPLPLLLPLLLVLVLGWYHPGLHDPHTPGTRLVLSRPLEE